MARIVVDINGGKLLVADELPNETANPFRQLASVLSFLTGNMVSQFDLWDERRGFYTAPERETFPGPDNGRAFLLNRINREHGQDAAAVADLYASRYFRPAELPIANIAAALTAMAAFGCYFEVLEYPAYVVVPAANYDDNVPAYLPAAIDAEENQVTWRNWKLPNFEHMESEGSVYIATSAATGLPLAGSILVQLSASFTLTQTVPQPTPPEE